MPVQEPRVRWCPALIAVAGLTALCSPATASPASSPSVQEALLRAKPAVALVSAEVRAEAVVDCGRGPIARRPSPFVQTGTAWFIDGRGFLVTNAHVIDPAHRLPAWVLNELKRTAVDEACVVPALEARGLLPGERPDVEEAIRRGVPLSSVAVTPSPGIVVLLPNGRHFTPQVVKFSPPLLADRSGHPRADSGRDLALLRISAGTYPALALSASGPRLGDPIHIVGFPGVVFRHELLDGTTRLDPSATSGRVSGFRKNAIGQNMIETDAAAAHGNSGGPAVNDEAAVVGMMTFISMMPMAQAVQVQGFNFLIPAADVLDFLRNTEVKPGESTFNPVWSAGVDALFRGHYAAALSKFRDADRLLPDLPDVQRVTAEAEDGIRNTPPPPFPLAWAITGGIVFIAVSACASLGVRWWRRNRFRIQPGQVVSFMAGGLTPVVLDVRSQDDFDASPLRLPGAIRLDPDHVARGRFDLEVEPGQLIVAYCASRDERTSALACRDLRRRGFRNVRILKGGLGGWANAGLPVESKTHLPSIGVELYRNLAIGDIERRHVSAGEVIFQEGEDARSEAYVIHAGTVEIRKRFDGVERHLNVMSEGELLGAMALFRKTPRSASAIAVTEAELLVLRRERLEWLIRNRPHLTLELLKQLSDQVVSGDRSRAEDTD